MTQQSLLSVSEFKKTLGKKKKRSKGEENLQLAVCKYIRTKYPDVIFMCDLASGMNMPIFMAARYKQMRSSSGLPDLFIAEPMYISGTVSKCGLFIELKKEGTSIFKKKGIGYATEHLRNQSSVHVNLQKNGYVACFAVGLSQAIEIIDLYMNRQPK